MKNVFSAGEKGYFGGTGCASTQPDAAFRGFGLIRHIDAQGNAALLTDPIAGLCVSVTRPPKPAIHVLWRGDVSQACFR